MVLLFFFFIGNLSDLGTSQIPLCLPELLTHFFAILKWLETSEGHQLPKRTCLFWHGAGPAALCAILGLTRNYSTWWSLLTVESAWSWAVGSSGHLLQGLGKLFYLKLWFCAWEFHRCYHLYKNACTPLAFAVLENKVMVLASFAIQLLWASGRLFNFLVL